MIKIKKVSAGYEQEALNSPFGFKGGYLTGLWQSTAYMESELGNSGIGIGVQSVLWSDAGVFADNDELTGNTMMFEMTKYALNCAMDIPFETPMDLLEELLPVVHEYGKEITGRQDLRLTFALNSLVAVDNAAWILYCRENSISSFDEMIPEFIRPALSYHNTSLASIPLITYGAVREDVVNLLDRGYSFLKIKIGSDPQRDGDAEKMLEWDKQRLSDIHKAARHINVPYTANGHIPYYLDANGRYADKGTLMRFLEYADKIGALDRIILLEEPFPEESNIDVHDIPVRLAADESAHSDADVRRLIEFGYGAIALKPIAKTMSMTLKIIKVLHEKNIPCFCADLTVNPVMVDWNKNIAARIKPLPGMNVGVLESNGGQNYSNWNKMKSYHPIYGAGWIDDNNGMFSLDESFYKNSGGIFEISRHYYDLLK